MIFISLKNKKVNMGYIGLKQNKEGDYILKL
jgi:hypothetical protein